MINTTVILTHVVVRLKSSPAPVKHFGHSFWRLHEISCHQIFQGSLILLEAGNSNTWWSCQRKCAQTGHFLIFPHPYLLYESRRLSLTLFHVAYKYYAPCSMQLPQIRGVFRAKMVQCFWCPGQRINKAFKKNWSVFHAPICMG